MPRIDRILETSLYVDDMQRSAEFYRAIFGFEAIFDNERLIALGVESRQVLLLFKKGASANLTVSGHDGSGQTHLAFAIAPEELDPWLHHLETNSVAVEEKKQWQRGGQSVYFRDPDGHLLELATPGVWSIY